MSPNELTETSLPNLARGRACVVVAAADADENLRRCLQSVRSHTPTEVPVIAVPATPHVQAELRALLEHGDTRHPVWLSPAGGEPSSGALTGSVNRALALLWPSDVALLSEPCRVTAGWLGRLREAALADSNTASASALADVDTRLQLSDGELPTGDRPMDIDELARSLEEHTMALRPRLGVIVGPCVYLRREALELVGSLDATLELRWALEVDLAQRCVLVGLAHVAADDVLAGTLVSERDARTGDSRLAVRTLSLPLERRPIRRRRACWHGRWRLRGVPAHGCGSRSTRGRSAARSPVLSVTSSS